jgi:hypothetical protein
MWRAPPGLIGGDNAPVPSAVKLVLDPNASDADPAIPTAAREGRPAGRGDLATTVQTLAKSTAVHVGFAFLAMGGWALYANSGHGLAAAAVPALAQGVMSGLITLLLKRALEAMSGRFSGVLAYVAPPATTAILILGVLVLIHRLIGTPEIARTIAVPWSVSTLYAVIYSAALVNGRRKAAAS